MKPRYRKNAHAVTTLQYHLVWCSKYRRPVLIDGVADRLEAVLRERAAAVDLEVFALEVMADHVHLFVRADPTRSVAELVNRLKGATSSTLRREFATLRSRLPTLWSRSYYAGTVGSVTATAVAKYIASQKGR